MVRLVIDTSSLIGAVLNAESLPARVFGQARRECELLISEETFQELQDVILRKKFDRYFVGREDRRADFMAAYLQVATLVEITAIADDCRDGKDNKFLSLALSGQADVVVSSDDDLLVLDPYQGIPVLTVRQYAEQVGLLG